MQYVIFSCASPCKPPGCHSVFCSSASFFFLFLPLPFNSIHQHLWLFISTHMCFQIATNCLVEAPRLQRCNHATFIGLIWKLVGLPINIVLISELNSTVTVIDKSDNVTPLKSLLALWKKLMSGSPFIKGEYQIEKVSETRKCLKINYQ